MKGTTGLGNPPHGFLLSTGLGSGDTLLNYRPVSGIVSPELIRAAARSKREYEWRDGAQTQQVVDMTLNLELP